MGRTTQPYRVGPRQPGAALDAMRRGMAAGVVRPPPAGGALIAAMRRPVKRGLKRPGMPLPPGLLR